MSLSLARRSLTLLIGGLALLHVPFLLTGHIQEDAFIALRTGFNLADRGSLSYNPDESYAAATSLLYAYWIAVVRIITGEYAVPVILAVNTIAASGAVVWLGWLLQLQGSALWRFALLVGLSNGALIAAFNGLETAAFLLYVAALTGGIGRTAMRAWPFAGLVAVSALVRPDAAIVAALAIGVRCVMGDRAERRQGAWGLAGLGVAIVVSAGLNYFHSGVWLAPSIIAKLAAYQPEFSATEIGRRIADVYLDGPLSLLPATKYLPWWLMTLSSVAVFAWALRIAWLVLPAMERTLRLRLTFLLLVGLAFPLAFVIGGVIFPWYFHPSSFALAAVLAFSLAQRDAPRPWAMGAAFAAIGALAILQLLVSINIGRQESGYRASVGRYLAEVAKPGDTLVLEPAGAIPFYAGLTTYDEVGLVSPRVLPYLGRPEVDVRLRLLQDVCPAFTVQREPFAEEETWLLEKYELEKWFRYQPAEWARHRLERWLLEAGSHADYLVYRRRTGVTCQ